MEGNISRRSIFIELNIKWGRMARKAQLRCLPCLTHGICILATWTPNYERRSNSQVLGGGIGNHARVLDCKAIGISVVTAALRRRCVVDLAMVV